MVLEGFHGGQLGQAERQRARQLGVGVQVEFSHAGELPNFDRNLPGKLVVGQVEFPQAGETAEFGRNLARQLVVGQVKPFEAGETAEFGRNPARQLVVGQVKPFEAGETAEFGRNPARQLVSAQKEINQAVESAEFGRDPVRQLVAAQVEPFEAAESAEFGWDLALQIVEKQAEEHDAADGVRRDPVPVLQRRICQPVGVAVPVRAIGRVVERHQRLPIRCCAAGRRHPHGRGACHFSHGHLDGRNAGADRHRKPGRVHCRHGFVTGCPRILGAGHRVSVRIERLGFQPQRVAQRRKAHLHRGHRHGADLLSHGHHCTSRGRSRRGGDHRVAVGHRRREPDRVRCRHGGRAARPGHRRLRHRLTVLVPNLRRQLYGRTQCGQIGSRRTHRDRRRPGGIGRRRRGIVSAGHEERDCEQRREQEGEGGKMGGAGAIIPIPLASFDDSDRTENLHRVSLLRDEPGSDASNLRYSEPGYNGRSSPMEPPSAMECDGSDSDLKTKEWPVSAIFRR